MIVSTRHLFACAWDKVCKTDPDEVLGELKKMYETDTTGRPRHYHTFDHAQDVILRVHELAEFEVVPALPLVYIAAAFHDAVMTFDPEECRLDEERSADVAETFMREGGSSKVFTNTVRGLIRSSDHKRPRQWETLSQGARILGDADLAILGVSEAKFREYEELVRKEWEGVPEAQYAKARIGILRDLRKTGFASTAGEGLWGEQARVNIHNSITRLSESLDLEEKNGI